MATTPSLSDAQRDFILKEIDLLHTYVHKFVAYRFTVFGAVVLTLVGLIGPRLLDASSPFFFVLSNTLIGVLLIGSRTTSSLTRGIWIICVYCAELEKALGQKSSMHHWLAINSYGSRYSTNQVVYDALRGFTAGLLLLVISGCIAHYHYPKPDVQFEISFATSPFAALFSGLLSVGLSIYNLRLLSNQLRPEEVVKNCIADGQQIFEAIAQLNSGLASDYLSIQKVPPEVQAFLKADRPYAQRLNENDAENS